MTLKNDWRQKTILVLMWLALAWMLGASLFQRFERPGLVVHRSMNGERRATGDGDGAMGAIGALMREAAERPRDQELLLRLVEALFAIGELKSAENFAQKAVALDKPGESNPRALYLLALVRHNKGEHAQAAELLETLLERSENPSARYSLGVLYAHYLNKPDEAAAQWRKALEERDLSAGLRKALEEEIEKLGSASNAIEAGSSEKAPGASGNKPFGAEAD